MPLSQINPFADALGGIRDQLLQQLPQPESAPEAQQPPDFQAMVQQVFPEVKPQSSDSGQVSESPFIQSLARTESGGNWQAMNREVGAGGQRGHFGRLQFGHARLNDAKRAGVIPRDMTPEQFMRDRDAQLRTEQWHFSDIDTQAKRRGLNKFIGQEVGGVPITQEAIRAMAHLGGIGGAERYLKSGGQHNPSDVYGTSLRDYARTHGQQFSSSSTGPSPGGPTNPRRQAGHDRLQRLQQIEEQRPQIAPRRGRGNFQVAGGSSAPPDSSTSGPSFSGEPPGGSAPDAPGGEIINPPYQGPNLNPHELAARTMAQRRDFSSLKNMDFGAKVEVIAALGRQSRGQGRG